MYLIVDLQVGLDIENCIAFYTNFADNLLARLHKDFDGICLSGFLILNILDVVKASECIFNHVTRPTLGSLSVMFRACVVSYRPGDIVAGCVVRPENHERITMISRHANAMIIQTKEGQSTAVLTTNAVAITSIIEVYACPGQPRISFNSNLYEPRKITYYYPIIPGTIERMNEDRALTCEKYADIQKINILLNALQAHEDADTSLISGITVMQAAQLAHEFFIKSMKEIGAERAALPGIVRQLFYPYMDKVPRKPRDDIQEQNLLQWRGLPNDATCIVMCSEFHPFDGQIGMTNLPQEKYPRDWVQGEIAQPAGVVLARRFERFIDYLVAGEVMAREFVDTAKLTATKSLIILQTQNKQ